MACGTAIAIKAKNGDVFAVESIVTSKLYEPASKKRMFNIDSHIEKCISGLLVDAKHLANDNSSDDILEISLNGGSIADKVDWARDHLDKHEDVINALTYSPTRYWLCTALGHP